MAGTTKTVTANWLGTTTSSGVEADATRAMAEIINLLVADMELLRAAVDGIADKLDGDAAITLTTYASGAAVATAATMTAPLIASTGSASP